MRFSQVALTKIWTESTHRWGKDHCTAGLQFNKTGTDHKRTYIFIFMQWTSWIQTCKTGDQLYSDPSPNGESSLIWASSLRQHFKGREPWSSGYGRRLSFWRMWVWIPVPYTGWTFFHINLLQNCIDHCLKKTKNKRKEAGDGPFFKKKHFNGNRSHPGSIPVANVFCVTTKRDRSGVILLNGLQS